MPKSRDHAWFLAIQSDGDPVNPFNKHPHACTRTPDKNGYLRDHRIRIDELGHYEISKPSPNPIILSSSNNCKLFPQHYWTYCYFAVTSLSGHNKKKVSLVGWGSKDTLASMAVAVDIIGTRVHWSCDSVRTWWVKWPCKMLKQESKCERTNEWLSTLQHIDKKLRSS